ncbi:MAG: methyltransferase domain-containing protein [Pseudomonadales bacterium]|nr:methyltransferase domain-containing protein [Pseudomonadales bacterium]MBO6704306.1 methyltransferase domain-containing protein [Pseudomonadales bacterium]MBO7005337.1 methyltransferase domain-containing protein [Pseudomonadales bacterium]
MSESYTGSDNLEVMLEARNYNHFLKKLVRDYAHGAETALDFGAGIGTFTEAIPLTADRIFCVEPDHRAQAILRSQGYQVASSIGELGDKSFDYIFTLNVLEHIENDHQIAKDLFDRLNPGQRILVFVPAFNHLRTSMDELVGHHRRYTRNSLKAVLTDAGFTVSEVAYTDFLGYFATWLYRFLDLFKKAPSGTINRPLLITYDRVIFPISRLLSIPFARFMGKNVFAVAEKKL